MSAAAFALVAAISLTPTRWVAPTRRAAHAPRHRARLPLAVAADADPLDPTVDDLYQIIGCSRSATKEEIRRAYRRRARTLHPDVNPADENAPRAFRRLVLAYETLLDDKARSAWESQRVRSSARARANAAWDDISQRGRGRGGGGRARTRREEADAREKPAGSRASAEASSRQQSDERRRRWREALYSEIWRDHMPLEWAMGSAEQERQADFLAEMELAVEAFAAGRRVKRGRGGGAKGGGADSNAGSADADAEAAADGDAAAADGAAAASAALSEEEELELFGTIRNRQVLDAELQDAKHRGSKHRERARWLEGELKLAQEKAKMWRQAAPGSEPERLEAMGRELDFLQLSQRLRRRLGEQRQAIEQLKAREKVLLARMAGLRAGAK